MYISPEKFAALPPEEQDRLMRGYTKDLSKEERRVLKKMIENERNNCGAHMITFEYMQELSKLSKEKLKQKIDEMNEGEARELLFSVLCAMFRHDRVSEDEIAKL